jgi:RNA-directed DNA polymerase
MNRFLKYWRLTGRGEAFRAHVIAYADDFVILSRGCAAEALAWTKAVMTRLGLTLNEAKTSLKNARQERFDFLGYPSRHYGSNAGGSPMACPANGAALTLMRKTGNRIRRGKIP